MAAGVSDGALIIDTGLNNSGFIRDANQFRRAVETLTQAVRRSGQSMAGGMDSYLRELQRAGAAARGAATDQAGITKEIARTEAALKRLGEKEELARRKWEASRDAAEEKAAAEFSEANAGADLMPWENELEAAEAMAEALNQRIKEVSDSFGAFEDTQAFRNINVEIEVMEEKLASLKAQLAQMQGQPQGGGAGEQARQTGDDAANAGEKAKTAAEKALEAWKKMPTVSGQIRAGFQSIAQSVATVRLAFNNPLQALDRLVGTVISKGIPAFIKFAGSAAKAAASVAKVAGGGALSFLRRLAEGARNAAIQMAKLTGGAINSGFKTLGQGILSAGKWMLGLNHSAGEASNGFKRGLWAILKYGLGIRSLYFLFRKVRTAISEGLGEIAKRNPVVNQQLNAMKGALNGLRGSLGSAFAPIFTAVAPALTYLINMLTSAINAIGAFMAALTGQKTYQKAVAGISGAGDAASSAGNAADAAADSYEDLKRELAGFDDLDVLGSKDSGSGGGSSGSGGGSGGGGAGISYETEEISSGITDFIGKVKEMWENADYEGIGRAIAGTINSAFEKAKEWISWDNLGATITEAVNGITGIFNGLVDGVNWTLIGQTFGEGVNTILHTLNLLLTGIDWVNLGSKLTEGLNSFVDTVDWQLLGDTIGQKVKAAVELIGAALEEFDWGNLGSKLAEGINALVLDVDEAINEIDWETVGSNFAQGVANLISGIDWNTLGVTLGDSFNTVLKVIYGAVHDFDFKTAATDIFSGVNDLIATVDWKELGQTIGDALRGALDFIATAAAEMDWKQLAEDIKTAINAVDWPSVMTSLETALKNAASGLGEFIATLFNDAFRSIKDFFDDSIEAAGGDVVAGIFNGIILALANVGVWIYQNIFEPFIEGFKSAFGIASPAKKMEGPGENIVLGIFKGITNALANVGKWVKDNIFTPIWTAIKNAGTTAIEITVSLVQKVGDWASDIWEFITNGKDTVFKTISLIGGSIAEFAGGIWDFVLSTKDTVFKTISLIGGSIADFAGGIWDFVLDAKETVFKKISLMAGSIAEFAGGIWDFVLDAKDTIFKKISLIGGSIADFTGGIWDFVLDAKETVAKTIQLGMDKAASWIDSIVDFILGPESTDKKANIAMAIENTALAIVNFLRDPVTAIKNVMLELGVKFAQGVEKFWNWITGQDGQSEVTVDAYGNFMIVPKAGDGLTENGDGSFALTKEVSGTTVFSPEKSDNWEQEWDELVGDEIPVAIDPTLPDNAGKVIEDEWAAQDPDLKTDVDATLKPTNTPGTVFDVSKVLNFLGTLGKKDSNQTPGILFAVGTALAFLGTLGKKDNNQTPGILFDVATALGFKGTLSKADNNQTPGILFNVGTVLAFLGTLSRRNKDDDSPKSVFNSGTVLGFLGTLARRDKDNDSPKTVFNSDTVLGFLGTLARRDKDGDSPKSVFNSDTVLGFLGTLSRRNKDDDSPKSVFNVGTVLGFLGSLSRKSQKNDSPGKVFDVSKVLQFLGKLKKKDDKQKPSYVFKTSTILQFLGKLKAKNKTSDVFDTAITVTATLSSVIKGLGDFAKSVAKKVNDELKKLTGNAEGGVISNGGHLRRFAAGGIISGGMARYLSGVPHYAGGTTRAHGTVFVAGEAGPEIMGHINGRTEILNKSQLAQTMYSAVLAAMTQAVSALGTFLSGQLANCTNAIVGTLGNLSGVANIRYHEPAMATGTVLPYDVAAQIARTGMDIQNTLDTNNEDLIQTIISVAGQIVAAVQNSGNRQQGTGNRIGGGLTPQQMIDDINRRTQMFGGSPLLD